MTRITGIRTIRTRSDGSWLIVKVLTDQPGLYGIGSASDYYQREAVEAVITHNLAPLVTGRDASAIEDIWQSIYTSGYWRNGSILNTALAGIDMALWDIKGKEAGMPVYQLLGGACHQAVLAYAHAGGRDTAELIDDVRRYQAEGYQVIRCQYAQYGGGGFLSSAQARTPRGYAPKQVFDDEAYLEKVLAMFEALRTALGNQPKLTHDVHEHLRPQNAVRLAKLLEPYNLFFLEDVLPPEQIAWFELIRQQCATPQAMGELFVNPQEWLPLVTGRLIDYLRVRVSKAGGITPCRKLAAICEAFGVHTAWQEGGDNDPVNQVAAMHLDMNSWAMGVQEENHFAPQELEAFPGHAELTGGYLYLSGKPGLGSDIEEARAEALLDPERARIRHFAAEDRRADGTIVRP